MSSSNYSFDGVLDSIIPEVSVQERILDFKKKIVWKLCMHLLDPPLPVVGILVIPPDATGLFIVLICFTPTNMI